MIQNKKILQNYFPRSSNPSSSQHPASRKQTSIVPHKFENPGLTLACWQYFALALSSYHWLLALVALSTKATPATTTSDLVGRAFIRKIIFIQSRRRLRRLAKSLRWSTGSVWIYFSIKYTYLVARLHGLITVAASSIDRHFRGTVGRQHRKTGTVYRLGLINRTRSLECGEFVWW